MQYANLGKSPLKVSRLCLGTMMFADQTALAEAATIVAEAHANGVNYIDTADNYNLGRSEEIMGATLMKMAKREEFVLSTKVGIRMSPVANDQGTGRKHLMAAVDEQLKRLQTD